MTVLLPVLHMGSASNSFRKSSVETGYFAWLVDQEFFSQKVGANLDACKDRLFDCYLLLSYVLQ